MSAPSSEALLPSRGPCSSHISQDQFDRHLAAQSLSGIVMLMAGLSTPGLLCLLLQSPVYKCVAIGVVGLGIQHLGKEDVKN